MLLIVLLLIAIAFIVYSTAYLSLHPFLALLIAAFGFGLASGMPLQDVVDSVDDGFGETLGSIGIVILAGTIIGVFLERTGGAFKLAEAILRRTGQQRAPLAMSIMGGVISIPVFCDSAYVILSSLNKAIAARAKITLAATSVALALGLVATHSMVPPTPGPIAAAGILGADLGLVIMIGLFVSIIAITAGWLFARTVAMRVDISPYQEGEEPAAVTAEDQDGDAPSATMALLPIGVPLVLIIISSIAALPGAPFGEGGFASLIAFIGSPTVALLIGVAIAFMLPKRIERGMISTDGWIGKAVVDAAIIIVITGAGGAFGTVLQNSGIADTIGELLSGAELGLLLPFVIASCIKIAQGSGTVALITTAGIVAPLLPALGLESDMAKALTTVAIGAGSMIVSHANDSFFWVFTRFSNMTPTDGFKLLSLGMGIEGLVSFVVVYLLGIILL